MHDQENRTDIRVGEVDAGTQSQAAVGLFSVGLVNQLKATAVGFARRMIFSVARASQAKSFLILLMAGLWCVELHGAIKLGATNGFETPPPKLGSIQWENIQRVTKERQELYRKRVPVPGAMAEDVPRAGGGNFATSPKIMAAQAQLPQSPPAASGRLHVLFFTAVFVFTGLLVVRKFAPHVLADLNQRFNPWALAPATEGVFIEKIRTEEESFAEFLAAFRVGPSAPPPLNAPSGQDEPVEEFYARAAKLFGTQRKLLQDIGQELGGLARQERLANLRSKISSLRNDADFPQALQMRQLAAALDGLLKQLTDKMGNVTPSTLRAVVGGLDLLNDLCAPGVNPDILKDRPLKFLVVDDDMISRKALSLALDKAFSRPDLAVDAEMALAQTATQAYDAIFLDVQMPGMDGFELCTKIRQSVLNRTTPVVFVTGRADFDARVQSTLSGGNDLMGKPFLTFEVTIKALTLALQGRLQGRVKETLPPPAAVEDTADSLAPVADDPGSVPNSAVTLPTTPADRIANIFLSRASKNLGPLRELCRTIDQTSDEETRQTLLVDGFLRINSLISQPGSEEVVHPACQISAALEGLFKKMLESPKNSTPSTLATVTAAVDLLGDLCVPGLKPELGINPPVQLLVVDDDLVARRVIVGALQTAFTRPDNVENGEAALALAKEKPFDVIFLDVVMPGMDGFEVCSKIRETIPNRATPVVFVTANSDFDARVQMSRHGGNDLMGKPFLTAEITVKALTFALRSRLQQLKTPPAS